MSQIKEYFRIADISEAVNEMKMAGAALLPRMICEPFRLQLADEASRLPYREATEFVGRVRQKFDYCAFLRSVPGSPALEHLRFVTEELVRGAGAVLLDPGLAKWSAYEIALNKYDVAGHLTAHRDFDNHPTVIVIWNICGSCTFELLDAREGEVTKSFEPSTGDLMLLRGMEPVDQRPFHRVRNIRGDGPRISATVRDNTDPQKRISGFQYANA